MNELSNRGQPSPIIPVTPNLEQYKLHGKHKAKKKNLYPSNPTNHAANPDKPITRKLH